MARTDFIAQARELGFNVEDHSSHVEFLYESPVGSNIGKKVMIAFVVDDSFPMNCPTGPSFKEIDIGWVHSPNNVHPNYFGFGQGWFYWSRPFPEWNSTDHTVKAYMAHVRRLLMTV